jgi:hypothetical protein
MAVASASSVYSPSEEDRKAINLVVKAVESCERDWHDSFCAKVEQRYSAYRGIRQQAEGTAGWRSNVTAPYLLNIVEGMLATMADPSPFMSVAPLPTPGEDLRAVMARLENAESAEAKLNSDLNRDRFAEKQRPFMQQDLIAGFTVAKQHRLREKKTRRYLKLGTEIVYDEYGGTIDIIEGLQEAMDEGVLIRDSPTMEVRDVRDFMLPGSATSIDTSPYLIDRTWATMDTLRRMEAMGVYDNVDFVSTTSTPRKAAREREMKLRGVDRTKGLIEVIEFWTGEDVVTIANRKVLLRKTTNPFWHGLYPFVVTSALPESFQVPGVSVIEGLAQMQDMLWTLQNTRMDATRMQANLITLIRSDVDDPDDYEWAPLAQWIVDDPNQVTTLQIDPSVSQITLQAEELLKGDIQNVMGGLPFQGGANSGVDQTTATGVSIINSIAQQLLAARKQQYLWAYERIGHQFLSISQQFMRDNEVITKVGPGGAMEGMEISPLSIQGVFDVKIQAATESLMRQERRAEWQTLLNMALQGAGVSAQLGANLNIKAFWESLLKSYDVQDKERYFKPSPAPAPAAQGEEIPGMGSPPSPDNATQPGVTNEALAAGPSSPSSSVSMSPVAAQQQMAAATGAGMNG